MKRTIGMLVCMAVLLALCACGRLGDVNGVKTHRVPSEMYTQEEIDAAIDVVKACFKTDYGGCVLLELYYAGDETTGEFAGWAKRYNADEVIVLMSSYYVYERRDGLDPNCTYDPHWTLVREKGGDWEYAGSGY